MTAHFLSGETLIAQWRTKAEAHKIKAHQYEEDGLSIYSSYESGQQAALRACADELAAHLKSQPPSVPADRLWDAITQAVSTHGSAATFATCDHPNCLWLRGLGFGPVAATPTATDDPANDRCKNCHCCRWEHRGDGCVCGSCKGWEFTWLAAQPVSAPPAQAWQPIETRMMARRSLCLWLKARTWSKRRSARTTASGGNSILAMTDRRAQIAAAIRRTGCRYRSRPRRRRQTTKRLCRAYPTETPRSPPVLRVNRNELKVIAE